MREALQWALFAIVVVLVGAGIWLDARQGDGREEPGAWRQGTVRGVEPNRGDSIPRTSDYGPQTSSKRSSGWGRACIPTSYRVELDDRRMVDAAACMRSAFAWSDVWPFPLGTSSFTPTFDPGDAVKVRTVDAELRDDQELEGDEIRGRNLRVPVGLLTSGLELLLLLACAAALLVVASWPVRAVAKARARNRP